jgi:hypothetical protein
MRGPMSAHNNNITEDSLSTTLWTQFSLAHDQHVELVQKREQIRVELARSRARLTLLKALLAVDGRSVDHLWTDDRSDDRSRKRKI